ncbi:hypothetical protein PINS_up000851 [Pythium insidiosum]|nr:hypothetical protein PINS_up000851 [Pythium insidiosum]
MTHAQKYRQKILRRRQQKNGNIERPKRRARRPSAEELLRGIALEASLSADMLAHHRFPPGFQELQTVADNAVMTECVPSGLKPDFSMSSTPAADFELSHALDALQVLFDPIQL